MREAIIIEFIRIYRRGRFDEPVSPRHFVTSLSHCERVFLHRPVQYDKIGGLMWASAPTNNLYKFRHKNKPREKSTGFNYELRIKHYELVSNTLREHCFSNLFEACDVSACN